MVSSKLAIRDAPNIRLRCSRNVNKSTCFTDEQHEADDDPLPLPLSPCVGPTRHRVRPKRPRVCRHHANILKRVRVVPVHTETFFERTHGDVWSGHTGFFSVSHTTHHTAHTPQHNTRHNTRHNTKQHDTTTPQHTTTRQPQDHTETELRERQRQTGSGERRWTITAGVAKTPESCTGQIHCCDDPLGDRA